MAGHLSWLKRFRKSTCLRIFVRMKKVLYVAKGFEEQVARGLHAVVNGDTWTWKEDGKDQSREKKELEWSDYFPNVAAVKWTYMRGFECVEHPAGTWINIFNKRGRFKRSYRTQQKRWWCVKASAVHTCRLAMVEVTGDFYTGRNGRGRRKRGEKHKLGACGR